jgi:hypothetical protein
MVGVYHDRLRAVQSEWKTAGRAALVGLVVGSVAAWAYAWTLVHAPAVVAALAPALLGALVAGSTVDTATRLGVRSPRATTGLAVGTVAFAYLASWLPWLWLELRAIGQPLPLATLAHPEVAGDVLVLVYENGTGFAGIPLGVRWAAEALLVLASAAATASFVTRSRARSA